MSTEIIITALCYHSTRKFRSRPASPSTRSLNTWHWAANQFSRHQPRSLTTTFIMRQSANVQLLRQRRVKRSRMDREDSSVFAVKLKIFVSSETRKNVYFVTLLENFVLSSLIFITESFSSRKIQNWTMLIECFVVLYRITKLMFRFTNSIFFSLYLEYPT